MIGYWVFFFRFENKILYLYFALLFIVREPNILSINLCIRFIVYSKIHGVISNKIGLIILFFSFLYA